MTCLIVTILSVIFLFLGGIHCYWAFGGKWGEEAVIPTDPNGRKMLHPGMGACLTVFLIFMFATWLLWQYAGWLPFLVPVKWLHYAVIAMMIVFFLRATGDFKYVVFFKKISASTVPVDPYDCMYNLVDGAIEGAKRTYTMYIDSVKQDFRKQYVNVCSAVRSKVSLNTSQQIYHYTLYYYDQAGNLLRTVPPEGVDLIEEPEKLDWIDRSRRAEYSQCTFTGPQANTNKDATLNNLGTALSGANQSVEMWLYNADGGSSQVLSKAGNAAYFNVCIDGNYLHADVYKLAPPVGGEAEITASNSIDVNISSLLPLNPWTHVVLQGPDLDESGVISVFVNGVSCPAVTNAPPLGCGWDITAAASGSAIFAENLAYLKQLRMYKRLLTAPEIAANAKENCMGMAAAYSTALLRDTIGWGRFNTPAPGTATTMPNGGTTEVQTSAVYPRHRLSSDYAYNSLGQVVQQNTPDANTSYFWYDQKGRLFASRNANQYLGTNQYSYTKYDNLGRITEVGEKKNANNIGLPAFIADATVNSFIGSGTNSQITRTFYDVASPDAPSPQDNLRKRVSASLYLETDGTVEQGSYYSYDALGNVKTLWQKLYGLHEIKKIDYNYDLVSGKVNAVRYQQAKPDQFFYNYTYDAENRLTEANSGIAQSGNGWTIPAASAATDAHYYYYKHGPLARTRIGKFNAQGIDYAYTLQGWLKTINGTGLTPANDIGLDGQTGSTFAKDVMAYSIDYFTGDYTPIGGTAANALAVKYAASATDITGQNLFNGNISRTTVALSKLNSGNPVGYSYRYDQLNRLIRMRQHPITATGTWGLAQRVDNFKEDFSYDGNGNILSVLRNGSSVPMDNLTYYYPRDQAGNLTANTLRHIKDAASPTAYTTDLETMPDNNYTYDKIGNLIKDQSASITNINWSVYGKIKSITFNDGSSLMYKYDAAGNRIYKEYTKAGTVNKTWYVRDAQGNSLAVYGNNGGAQTYWKEQHLYGSSRLGMWMPEIAVTGTVGNAATAWSQVNLTRYELSNHLGNTLAVISDQQASLNATVYNMSDYTPFGMQMEGRKWALGGVYRYGFNGKENDNEVKGEGNQQDYGMRIYDPRLARFLSVDPLTKQYPHYTPYSYAGNKPIAFIDRDGEEEGIDNILRRREEAYLSNELSEDKYREHVRAMGLGGTVASVVVVDAFVTKGKVSQFLLTTQLYGAFNHNRSKTVEGRLEQEKKSKEILADAALTWGAGKIITEGGNFFKLGFTVLSKGERLQLFALRLKNAASVGTQKEAIGLINNTLDEVEDLYSGVKKAKGIPDRDDGRMYGILDEKYVKTLEDGTKIAYTKGNKVILDTDGGFKIQTKDGSKTLIEKSGKKATHD